MRILFVSSGTNCKNENLLTDRQRDTLNDQNILVDSFYFTKKGLSGYLKLVPVLRRKLNNKYDLIHAHFGWCGFAAYLAKPFTKAKLVVSFMGNDLIGDVGEGGRYTFLGNLMAKLNKFVAKYAIDYAIVKSTVLADKLLHGTNCEIIPNGVDLKQFYPIEKLEARKILNLHQNKVYLLFAADPDRNEKNFNLAKKSLEQLDHKDVELLVIYESTNKDLNCYYNAADCLVFPSIHEGSPNVIKEAMACNCPIVSTNVGDVEWVLGDTNGCYLSSFEIDDFAGKIKSALEWSMMHTRTTGRERIIQLGLDSESVAKRIIKVYSKVLRGN